MGKNTMAVILGVQKTKVYQIAILIGSIVCWLVFGFITFNDAMKFIFMIGLLPALTNIPVVLNYKMPEELNKELKKISLSSFFCSVLFLLVSILL